MPTINTVAALRHFGMGTVDRAIRYKLSILIMLLLSVFAFAQTSENEAYRLQAEDVIRIQVIAAGTDVSINVEVPIGIDGNVAAPFIGNLPAVGKTVSELASDLRSRYITELRLRDPRVGVTISQFRRIQASIVGFVQRPGTFPFRKGERLLDLLSQGGGIIPDRSDLRRATLQRKDSGEVIPVDLYAMLVRGDTSQNYELKDGDTLVVPEETRNRVYVFGAVSQAGVIPYREPMTVLDAFITVGAGIPTVTKLSDVTIFRKNATGQLQRIKVDLVKYIDGRDITQNVNLQPGDTVYVGQTNRLDANFVRQIADALFIFDRLGVRLFRF